MKCVISENVVNYDFETASITLFRILSDLELKGEKDSMVFIKNSFILCH